MKKFLKINAVFAALVLALACFIACSNDGDDVSVSYPANGNNNDYSKETYYKITNADDLVGTWKGEFRGADYVDEFNNYYKEQGSSLRVISSTEVEVMTKTIEKRSDGHYYANSECVGNGSNVFNQDMSAVFASLGSEGVSISDDKKTITLNNWKNPSQNFDFYDCGDETKFLAGCKDDGDASIKINSSKTVVETKVVASTGITETGYLVKQ